MIGIAAQVSLYPLRQQSLSPAINEALRIFRERGLDVQPGVMSTVITGDDADVFAAVQEAFRCAAEQGQVVMAVTFSNACPVPGKMREEPIAHETVMNRYEERVANVPKEKLTATMEALRMEMVDVREA